MTDIEYASEELIKRLDDLAIPDLLRAKLMLYILKSLKDEETLDNNCRILDKEENKNDYDLVKIIGIMDINEKYEHFLVPNKISKTAVRYLARCQVRKD